jgi:hypothetical protein
MPDDIGTIEGLEWQGRAVSRRTEIEVPVESPKVRENLTAEHKIRTYRLIQFRKL